MGELFSATLAGISAGLLICLLIGPVFFALLQTSIERGFKAAAFLAFGIMMSDSTYILLAFFGVQGLNSNALVNMILGISGGVFLLANCIAGAYLILEQIERKREGIRPTWALRLPKLETLDQLSYRLVALVFPLWTFAIIAGAIWAEAAWEIGRASCRERV